MDAKYFFYLLSLILGLQSLSAQSTSPAGLIHSVEAGYQNAIFDPAQGLTIRANHIWRETGKRRFQTGVMLSGLLRPGASPFTTGQSEEFNGTFRLHVHTGWMRMFGEKEKWYGLLDGYVGMRSYLIRGQLDQASQDFVQDVSLWTVRPDIGFRLGLGYHITDRLGIQAALTPSLLEVTHPLGFWTGMLFWGPDVLALGEISLYARLGSRE